MEFFLKDSIQPSSVKISHYEPVLLAGSCFTENIGNKLSNFKFKTLANPFGIIYNPISIVESILRVKNNKPYSEPEIISNHGKFFSLDHHGSFSQNDKNKCIQKINPPGRAASPCRTSASAPCRAPSSRPSRPRR